MLGQCGDTIRPCRPLVKVIWAAIVTEERADRRPSDRLEAQILRGQRGLEIPDAKLSEESFEQGYRWQVFEADLVFVGDRPSNIKRGQTISLKLSLSDETQAMLLEKGGFYQATGGNWVYVIDPKSGLARKRNIRVGRQNPNYYEVIEGLNEGEVAIISSYDNFGDKEELVLK